MQDVICHKTLLPLWSKPGALKIQFSGYICPKEQNHPAYHPAQEPVIVNAIATCPATRGVSRSDLQGFL